MGCGTSSEPPTLIGDLKITCHQARGLPDKDIGAMDPYVKFYCGEDERKSKVDESGGIEPSWNDTVPFKISATEDDTVELEVWDDDIGFDDFVAQTSIRLDVIIPCEQPTWFTLYDRDGNNPAGEIQLSVTYVGTGRELCGEAEAWEDDGGEDVGLYEYEDGKYWDSYGNTTDAQGNILEPYVEDNWNEQWAQPAPGYTMVMIGGRRRRVRRRTTTIRIKRGGGNNRTLLKLRVRKPPRSRRGGKGGKLRNRPNRARQRARQRRGGKGGKGKRGGKRGGKGGKGKRGGKRGGKGGKGKRGGKGGKGKRGKGGKRR